MKVLYIGDIMGAPGIEAVRLALPQFRDEVDLVIAQAENVSGGKGMLPYDMKTLQDIGVDFFTGGNHTPSRRELNKFLEDPAQPVIGPANMVNCPGSGWKYLDTPAGKIMIVSLLGSKVGTPEEMTNPLQAIDQILQDHQDQQVNATIINFHGDYSSEKKVIGYYLDGKVSAVIGDHWHIPTADAMVLPQGTAHITDVGMCGVLHSSLGVRTDLIIDRWKNNMANRNILETQRPLQFNAVSIEVDDNTGLAESIDQIQKIIS